MSLEPRAITRPHIELRDDFRIHLSPRREEFVIGDIRAFFHSIYTHAIPWAIHTKQVAKKNRDYNYYGNLIDLFCRNAQDGQTVGLPVGPDTSRLIAEVIASAIDVELQRKLGIGRNDASRYVDDYTISSPNGASGEQLLAALRQAVSAFELEVNYEKSAIQSTSRWHMVGWRDALRKHFPAPAAKDAAVSSEELKHFLYQLDQFSARHTDINVEKFGLQNARGALCQVNEWKFMQSSIINLYRKNSTLINVFCEIVILRNAEKKDVNIPELQEFIEGRISRLVNENRTGELVWLLFLALRVGVKIRAKKLAPICEIHSGMIALLAAWLCRSDLVEGNLDLRAWTRHCSTDGLRGPLWLFAFEATRGLVPHQDVRYIDNDPYFSALKKFKVSFFNAERGLSSVSSLLRDLKSENVHQGRVLAAIRSEDKNKIDKFEDGEIDFVDEMSDEQESDENEDDEY